jgi:hypothetical protein
MRDRFACGQTLQTRAAEGGAAGAKLVDGELQLHCTGRTVANVRSYLEFCQPIDETSWLPLTARCPNANKTVFRCGAGRRPTRLAALAREPFKSKAPGGDLMLRSHRRRPAVMVTRTGSSKARSVANARLRDLFHPLARRAAV